MGSGGLSVRGASVSASNLVPLKPRWNILGFSWKPNALRRRNAKFAVVFLAETVPLSCVERPSLGVNHPTDETPTFI